MVSLQGRVICISNKCELVLMKSCAQSTLCTDADFKEQSACLNAYCSYFHISHTQRNCVLVFQN